MYSNFYRYLALLAIVTLSVQHHIKGLTSKLKHSIDIPDLNTNYR